MNTSDSLIIRLLCVLLNVITETSITVTPFLLIFKLRTLYQDWNTQWRMIARSITHSKVLKLKKIRFLEPLTRKGQNLFLSFLFSFLPVSLFVVVFKSNTKQINSTRCMSSWRTTSTIDLAFVKLVKQARPAFRAKKRAQYTQQKAPKQFGWLRAPRQV